MNSGPPHDRHKAAITAFSKWLVNRLGPPSEEDLLANRMVEAAETNRSILTVKDLAAHLHISTRTLQRLARKFVGLSTAALIRRRRIQEVAVRLSGDLNLDLHVLAL